MDWLIEEEEEETQGTILDPWNILIVDDEEQIHLVTKLALSSFNFENRTLLFDSVYSRREAENILDVSDKKYAVILLDVVMETDDAGLLLVKHIREKLKNRYSRIILRTGQPGVAPEYDIIRDYDIDYYKSKTELKKSDLASVFYTSLRSYRDISSLELHKRSVEQVISSLTDINSATTLKRFASMLLDHVGNLIGLENGRLIFDPSDTYAIAKEDGKTRVLSSRKDGIIIYDENLDIVSTEEKKLILESFKTKSDISKYPYIVHYYKTKRNNQIVIAMKENIHISNKDDNLIKLFSTNISLYYEQLLLNEEVSQSYETLVKLLESSLGNEETSNIERQHIVELVALLKKLLGGNL